MQNENANLYELKSCRIFSFPEAHSNDETIQVGTSADFKWEIPSVIASFLKPW